MNADLYNISNSKIICRVLPFFARGRKMALFLESIASPLVPLHKTFLQWVYLRILDVKITMQTKVIIWYLNYRFSTLFQDPESSFNIIQDTASEHLIVYDMDETDAIGLLGSRLTNVDEGIFAQLSKPVMDDSSISPSMITIEAPAINSTESYTDKQYMQDIKNIILKYRTSFVQYKIVII